MAVLRREEAKKRMENTKAKIKAESAAGKAEGSSTPSGVAAIKTKKSSSERKRSEKMAAIAKVAETRKKSGPEVVKSSFCKPDPTPEQVRKSTLLSAGLDTVSPCSIIFAL